MSATRLPEGSLTTTRAPGTNPLRQPVSGSNHGTVAPAERAGTGVERHVVVQVAREVQIDVCRWEQRRTTTARTAAFHPENGTQRRLTKRQTRRFLKPRKPHLQTDCRRGFALSCRCGIDGRNQNQPSHFRGLLVENGPRQLRLVMPKRQQVLCGQTQVLCHISKRTNRTSHVSTHFLFDARPERTRPWEFHCPIVAQAQVSVHRVRVFRFSFALCDCKNNLKLKQIFSSFLRFNLSMNKIKTWADMITISNRWLFRR
jgi:hypothetical protein